VRSPSENAGSVYDRLVFHQRLNVWLHVVLAFCMGMLFLSAQDLPRNGYWRRGASLALVMRAAIPMLPYLISAINSRDRVSQQRLGFWAFIATLVLTSGAVGFYYEFGGFEGSRSIEVVGLVVGQIILYRVAARCLLGGHNK
jgi:hypothetical protein